MRSVLIENGCWYCPLSTVLSGDSSERLLASLLWPPGLPCGGLEFKQFVPCPCRTKLTENRAEFAGSSRQMAHGTPSRQPQLLVSCRLTAVLARGKENCSCHFWATWPALFTLMHLVFWARGADSLGMRSEWRAADGLHWKAPHRQQVRLPDADASNDCFEVPRVTCGGKECKCEPIAAHARMMADADAATTLFLGSCCHQLCP